MATLLEQAAAYIKAGDTENGKKLLLDVLKQNPRDENAWLWMSKCVTSKEQKRDCFQRVLQINPNNQFAQEELRRLDTARSIPPAGPTKATQKKSSFTTPKNMLITRLLQHVNS
jgi:Tfp pilus assembly protein PilF